MNSVSAVFQDSQRVYTYITKLDLKVGQRFLTKTPSKGWTYVTVQAVPAQTPVDPNAKFEYQELKNELIIMPILVDDEEWFLATALGRDDAAGKAPTEDQAINNLCAALNK